MSNLVSDESTDLAKIQRFQPSERSRKDAELDRVLVKRFNEGDQSVFPEIMERHRPQIYTVCMALLRNSADAEEVAQDTFVRAYLGLGKFRGDSSLSTWLHRIATNLSRNRHWYNFRRRRQDTLSLNYSRKDESSNAYADGIASSEQDPNSALVIEEFSMIIAAGMKKLNREHREILIMRNIKNMPYEDIAAVLNINVGTVKSRIARARNGLRRFIGEKISIDGQKKITEFLRPERQVQGFIAVAS